MIAEFRETDGRHGESKMPSALGPSDHIAIAYSIKGQLQGPTLLVCGRREICSTVFKRIKKLPSLPWLKGELILTYIGRTDLISSDSRENDQIDDSSFDDCLFLDFHIIEEIAAVGYRNRAYFTILRKMTEMGMISGRGVTTR